MTNDKNNNGANQETQEDQDSAAKHPNPFVPGEQASVSDEELEKVQEFKEAQTERD